MRVRLGHALPLILTFGLGSCVRLGGQRGEPVTAVPGSEGTATSIPTRGRAPTPGVLRKRVAAKQDPNVLLAEDGTSCPVTADRYRDVSVGDHVVCMWL